MPALPWSDGLKLGLPVMDDTHQEFVDLLARAEAADDAALPGVWRELVEHTVDHFGREDAWMLATGFALANAHTNQHRAVLRVMRKCGQKAAQGDFEPLRKLIPELAVWFPRHAQSVDAALVLHLRGLGYDPETGEVARPEHLPREEVKG